MTDKTEKLNSALKHTRQAMRELDDVASTLISEYKLNRVEYDSLDDVYSVLVQAEQKLIKLKD